MASNSAKDKALEQAILSLNFKIFGIAFGVVLGLVVFIATNWLIVKANLDGIASAGEVGPHLGLLANFFIGYSVTFFGSIVGFIYGFAIGTLGGSLIAALYTLFVRIRGSSHR